jgi:hypothetical protein
VGSGSGTCERWETQPRPRAVLGQPRRPLGAGPVRPRSKAQRPRCRVGAPQGVGRDVSRPWSGDPGPPGSHALSGRSRVTWIMRLVARHPPRLRGRRKQRNAGDPLAQSRKQGPIFFVPVLVARIERSEIRERLSELHHRSRMSLRSIRATDFRGDERRELFWQNETKVCGAPPPPHASPISRRISAVCSPSRGEGRGEAIGLPPTMIGVRTPGILPSLAAVL